MSRRWPGPPLEVSSALNHLATTHLHQLVLSPTSNAPSNSHSSLYDQELQHQSNASFDSKTSSSLPDLNLMSEEIILGANSDQSSSATPSSQQEMNYRSNTLNASVGSFTRNQDDHRKRKRNRTMQSCLPCHTNKRKCNRGRPCQRCTSLGMTGNCVYETEDPKVIDNLDTNDPLAEVARLRERVAELEAVVRLLKGRPNPKQRASMGSGTIEQGSSTGSSTPRLTTPTFARTHSQSVSGVPWSPASTNHPSILDIYQADCGGSSATAGSLPPSPSFDSITHHPQPIRQRHYNFKSEFEVYPGESEKDSIYHTHQPIIPPRPASCPPCMAEYLDGKNVIQDDDDGQKVFLGNVSGGSLLRKLQGLTSPPPLPRTLGTQAPIKPKGGIITAKVAYMGLFGGAIGKRWPFDVPCANDAEGIVDFLHVLLPSSACALQLLEIFLEEVDCFYHAWHTPTLTEWYRDFFSMSRSEQAAFAMSKLSVILAIITVTIDLSPHIFGREHNPARELASEYRKELKHWQTVNSKTLASLTVDCLKKASYLGHPSLECIQSQLILSLYLVNNGRCTDAWCFIGGFIKQAQCLGLHIDPEKVDASMSMLEKEVRRRIWWATQTWDVSLSIAFGWPTGVTLNDTDIPEDRPDFSLYFNSPTQAPELPPNGINEMSYHVYSCEACQYAHHMMDKVFRQARWRWSERDSKDDVPQYEQVVTLDSTIRAWYNKIPVEMRFEPDPLLLKDKHTVPPDLFQLPDAGVLYPSSSGVSAEDIKRRKPKWAKQALMLAITQNTIILLSHRPFIGQSVYSASNTPAKDYQLSAELKCLRASHVIIEAQRLLVQLFPATHRMWYGWFQAFHAAMTSAWISLLHPSDHPFFHVGQRCIELAIEAFDMGVDKENAEDHHLRACSQLKAIQSFIGRESNSKTLPHPSHVMGSLRVPGAFANYPGNLNPNWMLPPERVSLARTMTHDEMHFTSAPYSRIVHPGMYGYYQHPPQFHTSSLQPVDKPSTQNMPPSSPSAPCDSSGHAVVSESNHSHRSGSQSELFDPIQPAQASGSLHRAVSHEAGHQSHLYHTSLPSSSSQAQHSQHPQPSEHQHHPLQLLNAPNFAHDAHSPVKGFLTSNSSLNLTEIQSSNNNPSIYAPSSSVSTGSMHYHTVPVPMSVLMMSDLNMNEENTSGRYTYHPASSSDSNGVVDSHRAQCSHPLSPW